MVDSTPGFFNAMYRRATPAFFQRHPIRITATALAGLAAVAATQVFCAPNTNTEYLSKDQRAKLDLEVAKKGYYLPPLPVAAPTPPLRDLGEAGKAVVQALMSLDKSPRRPPAPVFTFPDGPIEHILPPK